MDLLIAPKDEPNLVEAQDLHKLLIVSEIYNIDPLKIIYGEIDRSILILLQLKMFLDGVIEYGEASQEAQEEIQKFVDRYSETKNTQKKTKRAKKEENKIVQFKNKNTEE